MIVITEEKRIWFAVVGWPKPTDAERCLAVTLVGARCAHRRAKSEAMCQQHLRRINKLAKLEGAA